MRVHLDLFWFSLHHSEFVNLQVFEEVHKECSCDGLSTEDFQLAISISPDFSRY